MRKNPRTALIKARFAAGEVFQRRCKVRSGITDGQFTPRLDRKMSPERNNHADFNLTNGRKLLLCRHLALQKHPRDA